MRLIALSLLACAVAHADTRDAEAVLEGLLSAHSFPVTLERGVLSGPGLDVLLAAAANAQFVNVAEAHGDYDIPRFTSALFAALHAAHGFDYFATEQDPLMMQWMSEDPVRGDEEGVYALARKYPYGFTFISDQELEMLATIGATSTAAARFSESERL